MANAHRTNVLVTSCLKTPVDPRTRARLTSYERERALPCAASCHWDHRHREEEEYEDSGSDSCDEDGVVKGGSLAAAAGGDRLDLSEIFFSNEEYYSKLEELKKAHLRTMAELEGLYRHKLQLRAVAPLDATRREAGGHRLPWSSCSPAAPRRLKKSRSAVELRRSSGASDSSDGGEDVPNGAEPGSPFSPRELIENMWRDFQLSPHLHHLSSSSVRSLPTGRGTPRRAKGRRRREDGEEEEEELWRQLWRHRLTVPKPFQMTLREAERRRRGVKSRSQMEHENTALRRQLEELTECQKKFRAGAVPAHVHLPLYEELQERRRRRSTEREDRRPRPAQKPFSFLERERLKKEQKQPAAAAGDQEAVKPFKAKPVPKAVYAAASGEQMKEEQLYRSIKIQMRAQETLHSAAAPPGELARRRGDRKRTGDKAAAASGDDGFSHRPHINAEVPDHDASYRRFRRHLERQKGTKPTTACEPFELRTARIASRRERILADMEEERGVPWATRRPYVGPGPTRRATSSRCSSVSGSLELLPAKVTGASRKREEAVRKLLQERKKAEEEEERWKERQRRREKKLQRVVRRRAQAHDPHLALAQAHPAKLKEFRNQELQRQKEYELEIKEMKQRVKGRPLLLEQVAQRNAKQAAEKRFADAVRGCDLTEEFISSAAAAAAGDDRRRGDLIVFASDEEEPDTGHEPVHCRKVFLDDGGGSPEERDGGGSGAAGRRDSDESYRYSDDHKEYSDDSEHEEEQEAGK
ncbi:protein FAM161A isoform X2 [Pseudoliparis swirei]|uniref:protein FAM161A isoform X2 n=1 Tax=Pseudoliparis swirei TaxID=2059687 RepID=UPI0024BE7120|nr:protein FAM161A isoform X2 [Pseudoliparis swirei]